MIGKNNTIKFITTLIVIFVLASTVLFAAPKKTDAFLGFGDIVFDIPTEITTAKDLAVTVLNQIIITTERKLLQEMTTSTVNWINSGFSGNPLFVQNPGSFFGDIAKFEVKNTVDEFGYDATRFPFGKDFALNTINSYKAQADSNTAYTLSNVINDPVLLNNYQNNFNVGGWNGFLINTQYPQNNYLGFNMLATQQLAQKLQGTTQNAAQKVQTTLQQGQGFLSPQTCPSNANYNTLKNEFQQPKWSEADYEAKHPYNNPYYCEDISEGEDATGMDCADWTIYDQQWKADEKADQVAWGVTNGCPGGLVNTTPGSVVGSQITTALGSSFRQTELGQAVGGSISTIINSLISHFLDKGLNALATTINQAPTPDNWSYYGNTLGGDNTNYNTGPTTTPPATNTPFVADKQEVAVTDGNFADVNLSGGTPPYNVTTQPDISLAVGYIADNTLTIGGTGTTSGQTAIVVQDSASPANTITIQITAITDNTPTLTNPVPTNPGGTVTCTTADDGTVTCQPTNNPTGPPLITISPTSGGGGGNGCEVGVGSGTPPAPLASPDSIGATIVSGSPTDVLSWPVTTNLTAVDDNQDFTFDKSDGGWPTVSFGINYTYWLFLNINGQWVGSGFIQRWDGEQDGRHDNSVYYQLPNQWYYYADQMAGHALKVGEQVGFMVTSGDARRGFVGTVKERSNVLLVTLPPNPGMCTAGTGGGPGDTTPTTPTSPTPGIPNITSVSPTSVVSGSTSLVITGTELTSTVQFFEASGARTTVVGTVNSNGTQTTVTVPSGLALGSDTVKIYKNSTSISNGVTIQISSTEGAPVPVVPDVPATVASVDATAGNRGGLAYNPTQNNWLVTSALNQISGRIMGNDNIPVTSEFKINTDTGVQVLTPKAVFATNLNKYLVVWSGFPDPHGGTIYGRFVNPDGTFGGAPFVIFKDPGSDASLLYTNSVLRYDSKNNKFVFVWEYRHPDVDMNLITIDSGGVPGPVIDVGANLAINSDAPSLAINEAGNEYCVAYDRRSDAQPKVAVRRVNALTGALGPETTLTTVGRDTSIAFNTVNKQYLVGWGNYAGASKGILLKTCDMTNPSGSMFTLNGAGEAVSVAYNPKSNEYATIVQDQNDFGNTYNILSSAASLIVKGVTFSGSRNGKGGNFYPIIAPNTTDGTFAAISAIDYDPTRFASRMGPVSANTQPPAFINNN